ncbi:MAG: hypothetical protein CMJ59_05480 [Planctomycetaceae bacterium]|nr:hypothetical protein [Planctomycetaceae bacterium]
MGRFAVLLVNAPGMTLLAMQIAGWQGGTQWRCPSANQDVLIAAFGVVRNTPLGARRSSVQ